MNLYRTDLHVHSVLSPCGDLDMSPAQIVSLAKSRGLDIVGITDHNTTLQCKLIWRLGRDHGLTVIPGCEITSREEIHCLSLFEDFDQLDTFQKFIEEHLAIVANDTRLFGHQLVVDENDFILTEINNYLGTSMNLSVEEIAQKVHELSGIFIPAHIDRPRNSLFSQLAFFPPELKVEALQISKGASEKEVREKFRIAPEITLVKFSDAHYSNDLGRTHTIFEMESPTFGEIRKALLGIDGRNCQIPVN